MREVGVDEVGRGCLMGPVTACAVLLPENINDNDNVDMWKKVKDSKTLSPKKRKEVYEFLIKNVTYGLGMVFEKEIDEINILKATMKAMQLAIADCLSNQPTGVEYSLMIDGPHFFPQYQTRDGIIVKHTCVIKGDEKYVSISAASIIAKVVRDTYVEKLEQDNPILKLYDIGQNKGYGTKKHMLALKEHGITEFHRKSFKPVAEQANIKKEHDLYFAYLICSSSMD